MYSWHVIVTLLANGIWELVQAQYPLSLKATHSRYLLRPGLFPSTFTQQIRPQTQGLCSELTGRPGNILGSPVLPQHPPGSLPRGLTGPVSSVSFRRDPLLCLLCPSSRGVAGRFRLVILQNLPQWVPVCSLDWTWVGVPQQ